MQFVCPFPVLIPLLSLVSPSRFYPLCPGPGPRPRPAFTPPRLVFLMNAIKIIETSLSIQSRYKPQPQFPFCFRSVPANISHRSYHTAFYHPSTTCAHTCTKRLAYSLWDLSHYRWSPHNRSPRTKCGNHGWSPGTMHGCYTWSRGTIYGT